MKRRELDNKDHRISRRYRSEYKEFKEYEKSDTYKNVLKATNPLSDKLSVSNEDLKSTMQRNYNLSDIEYNKVLESLAINKNVDVHVNLFDKKVNLRLR
jgi:hypothetical protein